MAVRPFQRLDLYAVVGLLVGGAISLIPATATLRGVFGVLAITGFVLVAAITAVNLVAARRWKRGDGRRITASFCGWYGLRVSPLSQPDVDEAWARLGNLRLPG